MKVLFICHANVARSQIAQEYFNKLTGGQATSAGTAVNSLGLKKVNDSQYKRSIQFVKEIMDIDISENKTTQLTQSLVEEQDVVIAILQRDQFLPWLINHPKVTWWDIKDTPVLDNEAAYEVWYEVMRKVNDLVAHFNVVVNNNNV